jgi:patatin-like phospholipase/acyl hydrolase
MARRYLLSIDGGGIRGIIPLTALVQLERTTGQLARETFSFAAGTSTGAIIAAGIAAGISAERMLEFYLTRSREIFTDSPFNLPRRILFGSMYSIQRLHDVLADLIGPARNWTLNDSPIDLLITAKRVSDGMPWYFVRDKPTNSGRTGRLGLVDCVTASAAAPTYFPPWTIHEDPAQLPPGAEPVGTLVDGGVGVAGNPVYQTCVEAFYYTDQYQPEETTVVSLGTGRFLSQQRPGWIWAWLEWILGELLRSPGEQQTELVQRHFSAMPFYRIDPQLERNVGLDDVGSIEWLRQSGEQFAKEINWEAILEGSDPLFRITAQRTLWPQYSRRS